MLLCGERQNYYNPVIATNDSLLISEALSTAPLSQNVPTQVQFIDTSSIDIIDQMLLDAVLRPIMHLLV